MGSLCSLQARHKGHSFGTTMHEGVCGLGSPRAQSAWGEGENEYCPCPGNPWNHSGHHNMLENWRGFKWWARTSVWVLTETCWMVATRGMVNRDLNVRPSHVEFQKGCSTHTQHHTQWVTHSTTMEGLHRHGSEYEYDESLNATCHLEFNKEWVFLDFTF